MDTEAQHTERDPSSAADPPPDPATDDGSRSVRVSGVTAGAAEPPDSLPGSPGSPRGSENPGNPQGSENPGSPGSPRGSENPGSPGNPQGSENPGSPGDPEARPGAAPATTADGPDGATEDAPGDSAGRGPSWRRTGVAGAACVVFLLLLSHFVAQPFLIPSGSMEPTLQVGDRILVNKLAYRFGSEPRRGDVVVFDGTGSFVQEEPAGNPVTGLLHDAAAALGLAAPDETDFVKRIVGVGGDRVVCCDKDGRITVNGTRVDEPYLTPGDRPSDVPFDIVVPPGTLWVMGDHRSQSSDSRDHLGSPGGGMVPVEKVIGRADWIVWPFGRWTGVTETDAYDSVPAPPSGGHTVGPRGSGHG